MKAINHLEWLKKVRHLWETQRVMCVAFYKRMFYAYIHTGCYIIAMKRTTDVAILPLCLSTVVQYYTMCLQ